MKYSVCATLSFLPKVAGTAHSQGQQILPFLYCDSPSTGGFAGPVAGCAQTRGRKQGTGDTHVIGSYHGQVVCQAEELQLHSVVGEPGVALGIQQEKFRGVDSHWPMLVDLGHIGRWDGTHQGKKDNQEALALSFLVFGPNLGNLRLNWYKAEANMLSPQPLTLLAFSSQTQKGSIWMAGFTLYTAFCSDQEYKHYPKCPDLNPGSATYQMYNLCQIA